MIKYLSLIKLKTIEFLSFGRFSFKLSKRVSLTTKINLKGKGRINFGKGLHLRSGCKFISDGGNIIIEDGVFINYNCIITSLYSITIGKGSSIGPNVCIFDHDHDLNTKGHYNGAEIIIGKNVWIGANVVILKGTEIGDNSVVGAGSIITKSIPKNSIVYDLKEQAVKNLY